MRDLLEIHWLASWLIDRPRPSSCWARASLAAWLTALLLVPPRWGRCLWCCASVGIGSDSWVSQITSCVQLGGRGGVVCTMMTVMSSPSRRAPRPPAVRAGRRSTRAAYSPLVLPLRSPALLGLGAGSRSCCSCCCCWAAGPPPHMPAAGSHHPSLDPAAAPRGRRRRAAGGGCARQESRGAASPVAPRPPSARGRWIDPVRTWWWGCEVR